MPILQVLIDQAKDLKKKLKFLTQKYREDNVDECYRIAKQLLSHLKNYEEKNSEKVPQFFEQMHDVTVKIRHDLLKRLKVEQQLKINLQKQSEHIIGELKNELEQKQAQVHELQNRIRNIGILNDHRGEGNIVMMKIEKENKLLEDQNRKYHKKMEDLERELDEKDYYIKELKKQLNEKKQALIKSKEQEKLGRSSSNRKDFESEKILGDYGISRQYEIGNNSELPCHRNLTDYISDNNQSQNSDKKARSFQFKNASKGNKNYSREDELWRLILIQANALEQMLIEEPENQSSLREEQSFLL